MNNINIRNSLRYEDNPFIPDDILNRIFVRYLKSCIYKYIPVSNITFELTGDLYINKGDTRNDYLILFYFFTLIFDDYNIYYGDIRHYSFVDKTLFEIFLKLDELIFLYEDFKSMSVEDYLNKIINKSPKLIRNKFILLLIMDNNLKSNFSHLFNAREFDLI